MSTAAVTQNKIDELKNLFEQIQQAEAAQASGRYGSDLSALIDKLIALVKSLNLTSLGGEGLHMLLHLAIDTILPRLRETLPLWGKLAIDHIIIPLLKKLDEQYHPTV